MAMYRSIVEYHAEHESYRCGYCKRLDSNFSHGMWAHALTVDDYQELIDRGWRRSGKYCYKPTMDLTCCPMYTIRCRALEFRPTKSQKKLLKKFNKYLSNCKDDKGECGSERKMSCGSNSDIDKEEGRGDEFVESKREHLNINVSSITKEDIQCTEDNVPTENNATEKQSEMELSASTTSVDAKVKEVKKGAGPDPTKGTCKKAKQLRRERKLEKLKEKGVDISNLNNPAKTNEKQVEDFINELPTEFKQRLELKLVRTNPPSPEYLATAKQTHALYVKYQMIIHNDKPEKSSESKFTDFLVASPLLEEHSETGPPCGYGSFHQQYWLDGRLIAVGVIDILPKCVSSVYFFYDPQYMNLSLGTYGALREIAFTRQLHALCPELQYYYMGFYIHSCRKMRYKGNFDPSDLLCPETYKWIPIKECIEKLDASPYSRLDPDIDSIDNNYPTESDINYIPVWVNGAIMLYKIFKRKYGHKKQDSTEEVLEYAKLVGAKTAKSIVLAR